MLIQLRCLTWSCCRHDLLQKGSGGAGKPVSLSGLQGGPHNHTISGIAVALRMAASTEFKAYQQQIVSNCRAMADRCVHLSVCICVCVCVCVCECLHAYASVCVCVLLRLCMSVCECVLPLCMCMRVCLHICMLGACSKLCHCGCVCCLTGMTLAVPTRWCQMQCSPHSMSHLKTNTSRIYASTAWACAYQYCSDPCCAS